MDPTRKALEAKYLSEQNGFNDVVGHVLKSIGVQALSGIKGLSELPHGMDAAADAVSKYQQDYAPGDLTPEGADYIRGHVAPVYNGSANAPLIPGYTVGSGAHALSQAYGEGSQELADLAGKYGGAGAAGVVGAIADAAPMALTPEGILGKEAAAAVAGRDLLSKYGSTPVLPDGATERTLAREATANQRRATAGLPAPEVPPSDFSGRQAEHEGVVAQRNNEPAYIKARIPATSVDPSLYPSNFSPPDNAESVVAMDPQTGQHIGHVTYVKRGDGVSSLRMDVAPDHRGQGIGSDLLSDAISNAHDQGLPYRSDTQVSVPAAKTYAKVPGVIRNDDVTHLVDPNDGDVGQSNNGRSVFEIPKQVPADEAEVGETPHFDPNSYVGSQAFAEGGAVGFADGGEASVGLADIGDLVAKYAAPDADQATHLLNKVAETGSATYNPSTGDVHSAGYAVPHEMNRSVSMDTAPSPQDVHDFLLANQDAFENPKAAIHIESDDDGNHFMHVAHVEPDFEGAMAAARSHGAPGVRELYTGVNFPVSDDPLGLNNPTKNPAAEEYLSGSPKIAPQDLPNALDPERNERPRTAWKHAGVTSQIGKPKLEILATQIGKAAQRLGVSPETARDLIITGKAGAYGP